MKFRQIFESEYKKGQAVTFTYGGSDWSGTIKKIDKYGNVVINLDDASQDIAWNNAFKTKKVELRSIDLD